MQIAEQDSGFGPQKAKHFRSSLSDTTVTADEILPRWRSLSCIVRVNGEQVAEPTAAHPQWELGEMLAHASADEQLLPGELFGTGTLARGSGMEIGRWLRPATTSNCRSTESAASSTTSSTAQAPRRPPDNPPFPLAAT